MIKALRYFMLLSFMVVANACIEPFQPPVSDEDVRFLVVDAYINSSDGTASARLSRTLPVASPELIPHESGALVSIEDENGTRYPLAESVNGQYSGVVSNISFTKQYRLLIQTPEEKQYSSDYINLQQTPPIDSISYSFVGDGLDLEVNTHDASGNARYFRWAWTETYEYNSTFSSIYMFTPTQIVYRPFSEQIYVCWKTNASTNLLIGSTDRFKESVVSKFPIAFIPRSSIKFSRKYSIVVQQQTLTAEGYNYWSNLKKSTEQLGGLFDPLPSEIRGNIHGITNPSEKVIGFFSGGATEEKRIFLIPRQLPKGMGHYNSSDPNCPRDTILLADIPSTDRTTLLIDGIYPPGQMLTGYTTSSRSCIDCRYLGGVTQKPDFWEE
jgi:hypothetical protein